MASATGNPTALLPAALPVTGVVVAIMAGVGGLVRLARGHRRPRLC